MTNVTLTKTVSIENPTSGTTTTEERMEIDSDASVFDVLGAASAVWGDEEEPESQVVVEVSTLSECGCDEWLDVTGLHDLPRRTIVQQVNSSIIRWKTPTDRWALMGENHGVEGRDVGLARVIWRP